MIRNLGMLLLFGVFSCSQEESGLEEPGPSFDNFQGRSDVQRKERGGRTSRQQQDTPTEYSKQFKADLKRSLNTDFFYTDLGAMKPLQLRSKERTPISLEELQAQIAKDPGYPITYLYKGGGWNGPLHSNALYRAAAEGNIPLLKQMLSHKDTTKEQLTEALVRVVSAKKTQ